MSDRIYVARGASARRVALAFSRSEWERLALFYGAIALLHVAGWGLYLRFSAAYPPLVGLGLVAYMFGLRHAFDADHIAAIDDSVRYMLQKGSRPLGIGFFFSLGHSSVVLALSIAIGIAASSVKARLPQLAGLGGMLGATVSGAFLWFIGALNLIVLLDVLGVWKAARSGAHDHRHLEELLRRRGLLNRLLGERVQKLLTRSWHLYPLGLLFGLGFDTASEVGLLAMTAGASAGDLPIAAVLCLPLLFAAGMSLMDTTDGVLMAKAYHWALVNPLRKIFYNITTTGVSVVVALFIGTIELAQVVIEKLDLHGAVYDRIAMIDLASLGYFIVGLFVLAWAASVALWKLGRLEERPAPQSALHDHAHRHGTLEHSHRHVHKGPHP